MEEERGDCCRDGDVAPARTVVESGGKDGERGDTIEENCDSEPEERHKIEQFRAIPASLQYIEPIV